jgi:transcriptional regulator with XRE-family HTH domain
MISVGQIKAARGLLEWNQSDLAKMSGLHINAINNVERRHGLPRLDTITHIQKAFEDHGIRFIGVTGVELVQETLEIKKASGLQFIRILTDDTLISLTSPEDELIAVLPDEHLFSIDIAQNTRYYKAKKRIGFRQRVIISAKHGKTYSDPHEVRYLEEAMTGKVSYQVYGNKFVVINWETHEIIMVRSKTVSSAFKEQFDYLWEQSKP